MYQTISWLGTVTSWSLRWLPVKLTVTTGLQEVTVPSQEIVWYIFSSNSQREGKEVVFQNMELLN